VDNMDAHAGPVDNTTFLWITASAILPCRDARRMLLARRFAGVRATRSSQ
jgi:hypothetical protein